jgi:predicted nucleotide-binding protein
LKDDNGGDDPAIIAAKAAERENLTNQKSSLSAEVKALEAAIDGTLAEVFGHRTVDYNRYKDAAILDDGPVILGLAYGGGAPSIAQIQQYLLQGKQQSILLLQAAVQGLEESMDARRWEEEAAHGHEVAGRRETGGDFARKVFVVHGHDEGARESVARFLDRIAFQPIILHERANLGRTIIEKIEAHGDVGFAVVLLTPDDEGCLKGGTPAPRARQNVILELGYFIARLGRDRVCALKRGEVEIPSDFGGLVYETFDASGGWRQVLSRELQAAGYDIDWNKVMRE